MSETWRVLCDDAELAVESARFAEMLALPIEPHIGSQPIEDACERITAGQAVAVALATPPSPPELVRLANAARGARVPLPLAVIVPSEARSRVLCLAGDLGLVAVGEIAPMLATMALASAGAVHPWHGSTRGLTHLDRVRLGDAIETGRGGGRFDRADGGLLSWAAKRTVEAQRVGPPAAVADALRALRTRTQATPPARAQVDGVDRRAVEEVLFGPPRALSDPASKSALAPYGLPLPLEELCSSPSRAAAEAARLGFPVRISLASPDLRVWDHPDLTFDGVDNAARVRDVYRQIMGLASERQPDARLLGVHVTATTTAQALLRVIVEPLPGGYVLAELGFADPHGRAAGDATLTALPASLEAVERVLGRLAGSALILGGGPAQRKASVHAISDVLVRLAAFACDHHQEVERVELHPLALLLGGAIEAREACITVGDAYLRTLESPRALA